MSTMPIELYTDGSSLQNPGASGLAYIIRYWVDRGDDQMPEAKVIEGNQGFCLSTNNRMEIMAVIEGLKKLKYPCIVDVFSDSAYTVNAFLNGWIYAWKKNGWRKADGKAVINVDLWEALYALTVTHEVTFHKVAGHADNELNNRCDELARGAIVELRKSLTPEELAILNSTKADEDND